MEEERQGLLNNQHQNHESDFIDFEAPDAQEEAPINPNINRNLKNKQRIVIKYPDGSLSHGK